MPCLSYKFVCVCSLSSLTWLLSSWKLINCTWAIVALELSQYTFWLMSHNQLHEDRFKWKPDLKQCRGVYLFKPWPDRPGISYLNSAFIRENVVYIFKEHKAITMTQRVSISRPKSLMMPAMTWKVRYDSSENLRCQAQRGRCYFLN